MKRIMFDPITFYFRFKDNKNQIIAEREMFLMDGDAPHIEKIKSFFRISEIHNLTNVYWSSEYGDSVSFRSDVAFLYVYTDVNSLSVLSINVSSMYEKKSASILNLIQSFIKNVLCLEQEEGDRRSGGGEEAGEIIEE